jgi:uncharacterized protein (DUF885 family)
MNPRVVLMVFLASAAVTFAGNQKFDRWLDEFSDEWVRAHPDLATQTQYFSGPEQDTLDRQLTSISEAARAAEVAMARRGLKELGAFDSTSLDPAQQTSAEMFAWQLDDVIRSKPFDDYEYVFQQFNGLQVQLVNFLTQTHPIRSRRDIENYLERLALVAGQMDEGIALASQRERNGIIPPDFILQSTLAQFDRFLAGEPAKNVFVATLDERAAKLSAVSPEDRAKFVAEAKRLVTAEILPAFLRARALLEAEVPRATSAAGIYRFQGGDKAYANSLRHRTTTELSAKQVHQLGLSEVARIEKQMDALLREVGYADGSIKERMEKMEVDLQPPAEPDPRPALLTKYTEIVRDAERRAVLIFDLRPRAPVEVRREPPFTEKSAAAHYTFPAPDGSRPGIFWAPLPGPKYEISEMRTLVYHEAVPGHHFQLALQNETPGIPRFRSGRIFGIISAHAEGWALYAEQLAAENGWYEGDPKSHLGQLNDELFRARRLVVDTGLHAMNWTRQQAIDYGVRASEVERYVVWPGQACSYKIGMLKILELRAKAQRELGAKFSIKEFHNVVLQTGTVPLTVLEHIIDRYIASAQK